MPYGLADLPFFLALPLLLAVTGFFSASETALFGLTAHQRFQLTQKPGVVSFAIAALLRDPRTLLIVLMLGNMSVNTLYFVINTVLLLHLDHTANPFWFIAVSIVPLIAMVLLGEVLPKLVANTLRIPLVQINAIPLYAVHRLLAPVATGLSSWIIQPVGRVLAPKAAPTAEESQALSTEELEALLEMSARRGVIRTDEQQLIRQVLQLSQLKVRDVMVPRVDMVAIDISEPAAAFAKLAEDSTLSKILAINGDIDHMEGIIYARQFMLARRKDANVNLRSLVRNVRYVPEILRVHQLLEDFRKTGTKVAVAVDEYGGTAGLVTLKDIVERMVGDVDMDQVVGGAPLDVPEHLGVGTWRVSGKLSVHDWEDAFGAHDLPPRVSTVGGLVMALLGRVPRVGDRARLANLALDVEKMDGDRVESVLLRLTGPDGQPLWERGAQT